MDVLKLTRQPSLADQVLQILIDRIKKGIYPPGAQLPPENDLIEEFSVSRATLRSAFSKLEERSLIQRRQGVGTFISNHLGIANPLYQMIDYEDRIAIHGYQSGFKQLSARIVETEPAISEKLTIESGCLSLRVEKIWTADGEPIIYIINHIPLWVFEGHFSHDEITKPGLTEPFFQFFKKECKTPVDYLASCLHPEIVETCNLPNEFSAIGLNTPALVIEDVGLTSEDRPIFHSIEYLLGIASKFETIRRIL